MEKQNINIQHLSAEELMKMHLALRAKVEPIKRFKNTTPQPILERNQQLNDSLNQMVKNLSQKRVEKLATFSKADWDEEKQMAFVTKVAGNCWATIGEHINGKIWIRPFEILYLMEANDLELNLNNVPVSIEEFQKIIFDTTGNEQKYKVYVSCKRAGHLIREFDPRRIYPNKEPYIEGKQTKNIHKKKIKKEIKQIDQNNFEFHYNGTELTNIKNHTNPFETTTAETSNLSRSYYLPIEECLLPKNIEPSGEYMLVPGRELLIEAIERNKKKIKVRESLSKINDLTTKKGKCVTDENSRNTKKRQIDTSAETDNVEKSNKKTKIDFSSNSTTPSTSKCSSSKVFTEKGESSRQNLNKSNETPVTKKDKQKLLAKNSAKSLSNIKINKNKHGIFTSLKACKIYINSCFSHWKRLKQSMKDIHSNFDRLDFVKKLGIQTTKMSVLMGGEFTDLKEFTDIVKEFNHIFNEDIELAFDTDASGNIHKTDAYYKIKEELDAENNSNYVGNDLTGPDDSQETNVQDSGKDKTLKNELKVDKRLQNIPLVKTINCSNFNDQLQISFELFDIMAHNYKKTELMFPNINILVVTADQFPINPNELQMKCKNDGLVMSATYTSSGVLYFIIWEDAASIISAKGSLVNCS